MSKALKTITLMAATAFMAVPTLVAAQDVSPTLVIESGPSDNPDYRRMVFVKYLSGDRVSVNYRAYNRTEFTQVPNTTPRELITECANGSPTGLNDIRAFERAEARRKASGQTPEVVRFCIKNVQNWEGGGRKTYLDPIFNGLPYAASLNN